MSTRLMLSKKERHEAGARKPMRPPPASQTGTTVPASPAALAQTWSEPQISFCSLFGLCPNDEETSTAIICCPCSRIWATSNVVDNFSLLTELGIEHWLIRLDQGPRAADAPAHSRSQSHECELRQLVLRRPNNSGSLIGKHDSGFRTLVRLHAHGLWTGFPGTVTRFARTASFVAADRYCLWSRACFSSAMLLNHY